MKLNLESIEIPKSLNSLTHLILISSKRIYLCISICCSSKNQIQSFKSSSLYFDLKNLNFFEFFKIFTSFVKFLIIFDLLNILWMGRPNRNLSSCNRCITSRLWVFFKKSLSTISLFFTLEMWRNEKFSGNHKISQK